MNPPKTETTPPGEVKKPKRLMVRGPYDDNLKVNELLAIVEIARIIKDHQKDGLKVTQRRIGEALGYSPSSMTNLLKRLDQRFKCRVTDHREGSRQLRLTEKGEEIYAMWRLQQPFFARYYDIRAIEMIPLIEKVAYYFDDLIEKAVSSQRDQEAVKAARRDLARLRRGTKLHPAPAGPNAEERLNTRIAAMKGVQAAEAEQKAKAKAARTRRDKSA